MSVAWTLEIVGEEEDSLANWHIQNTQLRRNNLAPDVLTFTIPKSNAADDPLTLYGGAVRLKRDGLVWFEGQRMLTPTDIEATSESHTYSFQNAWAWLARNIFQQQWFGGVYTSHIIVIGSVGFNIKVVLDYAIANGCPIQYVSADLTALAVTPPSNEITGQSCASVILNLLQFAPDTVSWFDYTTSPPTLRFRQRPALTAVSLDMGAPMTARVRATRLISREDLQIPSAKICFETIETIDGQQTLVPGVDIWPTTATGREDGALSDTVVLQGKTITTVQGTIKAEAVDINSLTWWKKAIPALTDTRVKSLAFTSTTRTRVGRDGAVTRNLPRMIVEGQCEQWMINPDDSILDWQEEEFTAEFTYEFWADPIDPTSKLKTTVRAPFVFHCTTTNAPEGETFYDTQAAIEEGDPAVFGLAKYLYDSLNPLQWDAGIELLEDDCTAKVSVGNAVNILGLRSEHAVMRAVVQDVTFNIDAGQTSINCGPPRHLSISDILTILRANRQRRRWTNPDTQATGESSGGSVQLGRGMPNTNTIAPSGEQMTMLAVRSGTHQAKLDATPNATADQTGDVEINLADCKGKRLYIQETEVCENGATKKIMTLRSDSY